MGPLLALGLAVVLPAAPAAQIRFNRDVRPILSNHCFKCHGPDLKKAGLNLQDERSARKALRSGGAAVVPGRSAESRLIRRVTAADERERMPPKGKGEPLSAQEVGRLRAWIDAGAKWEEHWAYVKPARPERPTVRNPSWPRNDIDYFVLARLEREGLAPSPGAERATLIRRVSLDLTGLPPTPAEVDAFLADQSPDAYERVVDRLLASPHYGEHQARAWLDMARYADTNGYEKDDRRTMWPYRDWVIGAFNRNLPFDQFTVEQIAGDLLPRPTRDQVIATGFHRNTMVNTEGGTDDEEFRVAAVVDRVNTTMAVWMGTTMGCAQCHNHKFDPFSQKEFYGLYAFFNTTEDRGRTNLPILTLPTPAEEAKLRAIRAEAAARPLALLGARPVPAVVMIPRVEERVVGLLEGRASAVAASTLVMRELPTPRETHVLIRGNFTNPGEKVTPDVPKKWHRLPEGGPLNRLGLARWLVDPENPLVGRVVMNRLWAQYFGRGIVETSEDFGARGEPPSHPELLDWLATEFVRRKWDVKAMHRLVVTSATYRQSSRVGRPLAERDPFNRLLARGPRLRLDAELVRDNALAASGLLDPKLGGPSVFPYQPDGVWFNPYSNDRWVVSAGGDRWRRGLYTFWRRTAPYAAFVAFDAPSREVCTERRPRTNTPLQALAVLNDRVFVEASAALARRLMAEAAGEEARAVRGFRLCVARRPTAEEAGRLVELYRASLEHYRRDAKAARALAGGSAELAAWTVVANVLLNLDETLTKG